MLPSIGSQRTSHNLATEQQQRGSSGFKFFFEKSPYCFPQKKHHFTFPPAMHKDFNLSTSSPTLVILLFR